jgi:hypothetical protein
LSLRGIFLFSAVIYAPIGKTPLSGFSPSTRRKSQKIDIISFSCIERSEKILTIVTVFLCEGIGYGTGCDVFEPFFIATHGVINRNRNIFDMIFYQRCVSCGTAESGLFNRSEKFP